MLNYPWLEHGGYLSGKLLFLDLSFWINLSEPKNPSYELLKARLSNLVETGKLICPVSPPLLIELCKQPRSPHRDSISQVMDMLSKGLSLRFGEATFRHEFEAALEGRQAERQVAYSYFRDAFPPIYTLLSPEQGMETSITDFLSGCCGDVLKIKAALMEQGFSERSQQQNEWRQKNQPTRKKIEEDEWNATFMGLLLTIRSVLAEKSEWYATLSRILSMRLAPSYRILMKELGDRRRELGDKLDSCPSFRCHYKYMTQLRLHRRVEGNDIWDFFHATMAPYVDCLATDNATRHICVSMLGMDKVISKDTELIDWLKDL